MTVGCISFAAFPGLWKHGLDFLLLYVVGDGEVQYVFVWQIAIVQCFLLRNELHKVIGERRLLISKGESHSLLAYKSWLLVFKVTQRPGNQLVQLNREQRARRDTGGRIHESSIAEQKGTRARTVTRPTFCTVGDLGL